MAVAKRIFLFITINILVIVSLSIILSLFHVQPYLTQYGIDYKSLMIFCLVWGMGGAFISLALSRIMAKWMMGVKLIPADTNDPSLKNLYRVVEDLAKQAGLPVTPEVGIYQSPEVNAFATGPSQRRSLVAVSSGLLQKMNQKQLEGVLAHEITHIANGDMVTMTLIQGVINAFVMFLARVLAYIFSSLMRSREENSSFGGSMSYILMVFFFEIVFMLLGSIIIAWFSRIREYRADSGGAQLAGREKMISALEALKEFTTAKAVAKAHPSLDALKISSPKKSSFYMLFASHPPLEKRIERLKGA